MVELFLRFAFGGGFHVFFVKPARFGGGAALVVECQYFDFVRQRIERQVDDVARADVFAVFDFGAVDRKSVV